MLFLSTSTNKAIIRLKDELTGSLVQLRGDATLVAKAIDDGIKQGRFEPKKANVNAAFNTDVEVDMHNKLFSIF